MIQVCALIALCLKLVSILHDEKVIISLKHVDLKFAQSIHRTQSTHGKIIVGTH